MSGPERVGWHIDPPQTAGSDLKDFRVEEGEPAPYESALKTALVVDECVDGDVARLPLENNLRFLKRRAAPPAPYRTGIARCGRMAVAERARDVERVGVGPTGEALGLRQNKSISDEFAPFEIELPDH